MLTKLRIQNFKQFDEVEIELGPITVLVGPNNSGKTTALQALTVWDAVVKRWHDFAYWSGGAEAPDTTTFARTLNRLDLIYSPVPAVNLLWRNRKTHNGQPTKMEIEVTGSAPQKEWVFGLRLEHLNEESIGIEALAPTTPLNTLNIEQALPKMVYLTPMSGLASVEPLIQPGRINVLVGEGQTAQVLRNVCYELVEQKAQNSAWAQLVDRIREQFAITLLEPEYLVGRGEIRMTYKNRAGVVLDIAALGRGTLQMILLVATMVRYPGAVFLLDEPDAHLEILRQRDLYTLIAEAATTLGSQIIMATHSEVILEAAFQRKDPIIAFVGKPHSLRRYGDFIKSLSLIPAEDYTLANQSGWVLYTEGTTDYDILRAFATRLNHPAASVLELTFHKDIGGNTLEQAREHFKGLGEAKPDLVGLGIFDKTNDNALGRTPPMLSMIAWRRREIENYLMQPETLIAYAAASSDAAAESHQRAALMRTLVEGYTPPIALGNRAESWWSTTKASDDYLDPIFASYAQRLSLPVQLRKSHYYLLVPFIPFDQIDPEITEKLDAIDAVARRVSSRED